MNTRLEAQGPVLKRWLARVASIAAAFAIGFALVMVAGPTYSPAPSPGLPSVACPFQLSPSLEAALRSAGELGRWVVHKSDGATPAPVITARNVVIDGAGYCSLRIESASSEPGGGRDWRIGYKLPHWALRGRQVRLTLRVFASAPIRMNSGSVYIHDGPTGANQGLPGAGTEPREIAVTHTVSDRATTFEAWVRLVLDKGTIQPAGETLFFSASLAEAETGAGS